MRNVLRIKLCLAAALAAPAAGAQGNAPHPADAALPVPAARYDSAFTGYAAFRDEKLADWRSVNDDVARVGGHIGIVRGDKGATTGAPKAPPAQMK